MGGSKKGERRGGAKPRIVRKPKIEGATKRGFGTGGGRTVGTKNKPKTEEQMKARVNQILSRHIPVARKAEEIEHYFMAVGKRLRLPKEVMLDAMRFFEESAIEWGEVQRANLIQSAMATTAEERVIYEEAVSVADMRMREYLTQAVDVAYKVAPYVHPRLAALITNPQDDKNPLSAVAMLFKELDEAGRPPQYIDHDPGGAE
jgi:hypothetical protein